MRENRTDYRLEIVSRDFITSLSEAMLPAARADPAVVFAVPLLILRTELDVCGGRKLLVADAALEIEAEEAL